MYALTEPTHRSATYLEIFCVGKSHKTTFCLRSWPFYICTNLCNQWLFENDTTGSSNTVATFMMRTNHGLFQLCISKKKTGEFESKNFSFFCFRSFETHQIKAVKEIKIREVRESYFPPTDSDWWLLFSWHSGAKFTWRPTDWKYTSDSANRNGSPNNVLHYYVVQPQLFSEEAEGEKESFSGLCVPITLTHKHPQFVIMKRGYCDSE